MKAPNIQPSTAPRVKRRVYTRDFKLQVVQSIKGGTPTMRLSRELGVSPSILGRWTRELQADPAHAFRGQGRRKPVGIMSELRQRDAVKRKAELDLFHRGLQWLSMSSDMAFSFIEHYQEEWPVRLMCDVFGVSRSGYYDWLKRQRAVMGARFLRPVAR